MSFFFPVSSSLQPPASVPVSNVSKEEVKAAVVPTVSRRKAHAKARNGKGVLAYVFNPIGKPLQFKVPKVDNKPYTVMQTYTIQASPLSSNAVATFAAFNYQVSSLDQITSLQALFDQYRIVFVEVWLTPRVPMPLGNASPMQLMTVIDYDDSTALTTLGQALDYENVQIASGFDGQYRKFRPHVAISAYSGAFGAFANEESPWIDAVSSTVQHYGLKTAWGATDVVYAYDQTIRLTTEWKNLR